MRVEINKKVLDGLRYVYFALNVSKFLNGIVFVCNGNYWIYFVFNFFLSELYYGDFLGWNLLNNFVIVMKLFFEVFCFVYGKSYIKFRRLILMYYVNDRGLFYNCDEKCF